MSELALKRIRQAKAEGWKELDLGRTGLTELPEELFELENLECLILGDYFKNDFGDDYHWESSKNNGPPNGIIFISEKIKELRKLRKLSIDGKPHGDYHGIIGLRHLPYLNNLEYLSLSFRPLLNHSISWLGELINIKYLSLVSSVFMGNIEVLAKLINLQVLDISGNEITEIEPLTDLVNLSTLYISACNLINIYPLKNLTHLQSLDLSGNDIVDISPILGLNKLQYLDLARNKINDAQSLQELENLHYLNLSQNRISNFEFLQQLPFIQGLEVGGSNLKDLNWLKDINTLTYLSAGYNHIEDVKPLQNLINLKYLDIRENKIKEISSLQNLNNLKKLDITANKISDIDVVKNFTQLEHLYLGGNKITDINPLKTLYNLRILQLHSNKISNIKSLLSLKKISDLELSNNEIFDIDGIDNMYNLRYLNLANNSITDYTQVKKLSHIISLERLILEGNPVKNIPPEILQGRNCLISLEDFFRDIENSYIENNEIKLIFLGNGCVGKTTLAERLVHNPPELIYKDIETERTHGITIQPWELEDINTKVNVWDFGGQEIYHATHRLFLSRRTLYLLVWAKETEEQPDQPRYEPNYWLDYIADLGRDSRIIMVQNMSDLHGILSLPNESALKEDYAETFQLKFGNSISVSAQTGKGTPTLIAQIKENIEEILQAHRELLPKSWAQVRDRIEADRVRGERTLTKAAYHQYCKEAGISGTSPKTLLDYLHSVGAVYYQQGLFNDKIILDQVWALDGVYAILKSETIQNSTLNHGYFTLVDARRIWSAEQYSDEETQVFIRFMLSCEIAFQRHLNNEIRYIVPQLLKEDTRLERAWANRSDALHVRLEYLHLHRSIIERFIVRAAQLSPDEYDIWRNAIALDLEGGEALITAHIKDKSIFIRTAGQNKARLMAKIIKEFDDIRHFKDRVQQFVSLDDKVWLPKAMLEQKRSEGKATFYYDDKEYRVQDYQAFFIHLQEEEQLIPQHKRHDLVSINGEKKSWEDHLELLFKKQAYFLKEQATTSDSEKKFELEMKLEQLEKDITATKQKLQGLE